jgi:hypothetical protein
MNVAELRRPDEWYVLGSNSPHVSDLFFRTKRIERLLVLLYLVMKLKIDLSAEKFIKD